MSLPEILAGSSGSKITWSALDHTGALMSDSDVTALEYSVYDVTNESTVRARGAVGVTTATGTLGLATSDTQINGSNSREKRRVCFWVNTDQFWDEIEFWVVASACGS